MKFKNDVYNYVCEQKENKERLLLFNRFYED